MEIDYSKANRGIFKFSILVIILILLFLGLMTFLSPDPDFKFIFLYIFLPIIFPLEMIFGSFALLSMVYCDNLLITETTIKLPTTIWSHYFSRNEEPFPKDIIDHIGADMGTMVIVFKDDNLINRRTLYYPTADMSERKRFLNKLEKEIKVIRRFI